MAARVTPEEIIRMNQLFNQHGTYAAVAREMGRSPSVVARYVDGWHAEGCEAYV